MTRCLVAFAALAMLALGGCAAQQRTFPATAAQPSLDPMTRVAEMLADADNPTMDAAMRAERVAALDRMGLRRAEDSEDDPVSVWRAQALANGYSPLPFRGRALGPAYRSGWIEPGANKALDQLFLAGETAQISLSNSARAPMALTISDPQAKIICQQDGLPPGRCQWVSLFTQRYRIELHNRGQKRLRYFLVTN